MTIGILASWAWWGAWYPWAEENQGFLGLVQGVLALVALAWAIWSYRREQRRAIQAEADAAEQHRKTELLMLEQVELNAKNRAEAVVQERYREVATYVDTVTGIIRQLENALRREISHHQQMVNEGTPMRVLTSEHQKMASATGRSLSALLPGAPRDPEIILAVQEAEDVTPLITTWGKTVGSSEMEAHLKPMADALLKAITALQGRKAALQPPPSPSA